MGRLGFHPSTGERLAPKGSWRQKKKKSCFIITAIGCAVQVLFTYVRMGINLKNKNYERNHRVSIIWRKIKNGKENGELSCKVRESIVHILLLKLGGYI